MSIQLIHTEMNSSKKGQPVYYIFNSDAGYIIVSADDRAHEILAWGDAPIDVELLPDNMAFWMGIYKQQIEHLQSHSASVVDHTKASLRKTGKSSIQQNIAPLISAEWNQDTPYNKLCPVFPFANNARALTGCSATSLSMILHHWKYPTEPIPEIEGYTYYMGGYNIELPTLPSVTFDWNHMLDTYLDDCYTTEQADAVAVLMRHVGQQEKMKYSSEGSSALGENIIEAIRFFGYDEGVQMKVKATTDSRGYEEELINDEDWAAILQTELLEQRPVLYLAYQRIQNSEDWILGIRGHAFNVDGYDAETDTYHVNWGWGGKANGYFALNAFNGNSNLYNIGQSMIIGIEPPTEVPTIKVPPLVGVESFVNDHATATFNVNGRMLTSDVVLELNDTDGVFELDATRISAADAQEGKTVTVTYSPKNLGTHTATVKLSSSAADTTITLVGTSRLEVYPPALLPIDSSHVSLTQFRADWSDKTDGTCVDSYTLEVSTNPSTILLASADFSNYPDVIGNLASCAEQYIPEGWSYDGDGFWLDGGCIEICPGSTLTTRALDLLSLYDKVTVVITAKNWSDYIKTRLTVSSSIANQKLDLRNNYAEYVVELDCNDIDSICFKAGSFYSGYYTMIQKIEIYAGELPDTKLRDISDSGDANYRLITGIVDKNCTVEGLDPGGTYFYKVKARYVDGSESQWSIAQMITLFDSDHDYQLGDVNGDGAVNITDVTQLVGYLLYSGDAIDAAQLPAADVNGDGAVNITDVIQLVGLVLNAR